MECSPNTNRFFGPVQTHIKPHGGSFVAVDGPNMTHKLTFMPNIRFPYQQVLTGRITLRAGQTNYLLNHLGMGDNATFLAITAQYSDKSKFESDNYINYSYYSNKGKLFTFSNMLVLSGNSENRIEQLYLTNPNQHTAVVLEVMVGIIDEYYDFFTQNDTGAQSIVSFDNLDCNDLALWDTDNDVMIVKNAFNQPILYLNLDDINTIEHSIGSNVVVIDESSVGQINLKFKDSGEAECGAVKIRNWTNDVFVDPQIDSYDPIITFTSNVTYGNTGSTSSSVTSNDADDFLYGTAVGLTAYGGTVSKLEIHDLIIDKVNDYLGATMSTTGSNILINNGTQSGITQSGEYFIYFDISDNIGNRVDSDKNVKINIV